ncbi:DUF1801 domain-containing protein [Fulvivirga lutea]|uniref:DUF1801 domain-containing protein n=1 Tax=Fulvivirga lutea TaxID=2810512 RepID=A0A974WIP1_9BACT|nr:DUF1801 domain-containing protein [Fulvivirga lutea]QSE96063.1 DUF1801 domain-containing protein [Fulvivirga lutea]
MSQNKTTANNQSVVKFLESVEDETRRKDSFRILEIIKDITQLEPKMWGGSIIGFGDYHYKYDSGREGDFFRAGFSPRKQALTIYLMAGFKEYDELLQKLGKHKIGKSCLYIKSLDQVDMDVLKKMITLSFQRMQEKYPD